jgi:hypothetical protein
LPEHRRQRGHGPKPSDPTPQEKVLIAKIPELAPYIEALKKHGRGRATVPLRRLLRMVDDYPHPELLAALQSAAQYGRYDLEWVETMVLRQLARHYFQIIPHSQDDQDDHE